jgi:Ca2+-binding RTX toxin-like protein
VKATISSTGTLGDALGDTLHDIENLIGSGFDDTLTGDVGNNILRGGLGNDTLDGRSGSDTADYSDSAAGVTVDLRVAAAQTSAGSASGDILIDVENLIGSGSADTLTGDDGDNRLDGGLGNDTLTGGKGDDTYVVDNAGDVLTAENASEGTDTVESAVTWTLATNFENLVLTGTAAINGTGNGVANTITGNAAANTLNGGGGADTLIGGAGNDIYVVDVAGDVVQEKFNEGIDLVQSGATYTLSANVENLTLTGGSSIDGTGNALDNVITGNGGINKLTGGAGNDTLNGGASADTLIGGAGNDTYIIDNTADVTTEKYGEGIDLVQTLVSYTLASDVENLTLSGTAVIDGTGNALDNVILGNGQVNKLTGAAGNDTLNGGAGIDTLIGGVGDDTYVIDTASDVVTEGIGEGTDTVFSSATYTLAANVENLTLTGSTAINGTGNGLDNIFVANGGGNTFTGLLGNDTYYVDKYNGSSGDVVVEAAGEGTDTIVTANDWTLGANLENLTLTTTAGLGATAIGNSLGNKITGGAGDDYLQGLGGDDDLNGGTGNDIVQGGAGIDTYRFDRGGGTDSLDVWDSDGSADKLAFGANIATDQLWFRMINDDGGATADDLEISIIGTTDKVFLHDWFASADDKVERVQTNGKYAQASDVQALVTAMSAFSPPPLGQTTLDPTQASALAPTLAASWH